MARLSFAISRRIGAGLSLVIAAAIAAVPRPRALVTTPFHLRTLLEAGVQVVAVSHHHHLETAQQRVGAQLAHQEHHGQALA